MPTSRAWCVWSWSTDMADPISLRVLYAIRSRLQLITGGTPYNTTAGDNVVIGAASMDAESQLPCCVIREIEESATAAGPDNSEIAPTDGSRKMLVRLGVSVEGYAAGAQSNVGEIAAKLKADIKRAVMSGGPLEHSGLRIGPISYGGAESMPREDGSNAEGVRVRFVATYTEKVGDPDALK